MRTLLAIARTIDIVNNRVGRAVTWLILIAVLVSTANATARKLFSASSNAWLELQWYLFGAVFLLAAGYTLLKNEHVRVDALSQRFSERSRMKIEILGVLLFILPACGVIMWLSWPIFMETFIQQEMSSNAGGLIRWPAWLLIPVGFALLIAASISHLIKCIGCLRGLCPDPTHLDTGKTGEELLAEEISQASNSSSLNSRRMDN